MDSPLSDYPGYFPPRKPPFWSRPKVGVRQESWASSWGRHSLPVVRLRLLPKQLRAWLKTRPPQLRRRLRTRRMN
jgi:hypothetical protein